MDCDGNNLSSLDVSNNTHLLSLDCSDNNLSNLDLNNNTELSILRCSENNIKILDVRNTSIKVHRSRQNIDFVCDDTVEIIDNGITVYDTTETD